MADRPGTSQPANGNSPTAAGNEPPKDKKNKPKATRLRQQKLPAWQPILTASTVIPAIFGIGIAFLPIGIVLYLASEGVTEYEYVYTDCPTQGGAASALLDQNPGSTFICSQPINLPAFNGDVYFYYGLDNFYQNHRRYVKSRSDAQLVGDLSSVSDCAPYQYPNGTAGRSFYAPCGAVANSMFNDTFELQFNEAKVPFSKDGIIWSVDREKKFKNPTGTGTLKEIFDKAGAVKPPNWQKNIYDLDNDTSNNGFENVDFIVWMRTAALPNFRKLYRKLDRTQKGFENGLPQGTYTLKITYQYPVKSFNGEKKFVISTTSWAGAKNSFLGIAYMVVGVFCIVLGVVFLGIHIKFGNSLTEISNVRSGTS